MRLSRSLTVLLSASLLLAGGVQAAPALPLPSPLALPLPPDVPQALPGAPDISLPAVPDVLTRPSLPSAAASLPAASAQPPGEPLQEIISRRLEPGQRLLPLDVNLAQLQALLPHWALLDEFGRPLLPVTEDLLTDAERKLLGLTRCQFIHGGQAELAYGDIEPRQASAMTTLSLQVLCPQGQSFRLAPLQDNQPVAQLKVPADQPDAPPQWIHLLDASGLPLQDKLHSGTGRIETVEIIALLRSADGSTRLSEGPIRLPANSRLQLQTQ